MKKIVIAILAIGILALSGCSLFTTSTTEILPTPTPAPVVVEPLQDIYNAGVPADAPFDEVWLSPATYTIQNYYAGYTIKCILLVHNGNAEATPFSVLYTQPDNVDAGF